jgi:hypothetical protein
MIISPGGTTTRVRRPGSEVADELQAALEAGLSAQGAAGDLAASRRSFERAYQLAEQAGQVQAMAQAAVGLAGLWVREHRTVTGAVRLEARLQHVLSLLDPRSSLGLRIRARLAGEADYFRGEHTAILAVLSEARADGDAVPLAEALSIAHHCLLGPDHVRLRQELATDLIKASFRTGRRSDLLMGLLWQTVDAYSAGDPHAGRFLGELRDQLKDEPHLAVGFVVSAMDVMLAIRGGQLGAAESLAGSCAASGAAAGDVDYDWWSGAQLVTIRWYQGRLAELLPMLHDRVHSAELSVVDDSSVAALAVAAALAGDRRTATSSLAALRGQDLSGLSRSSSWLVTMNGVVEAAYLLGDAELAAEAYQLLRPYAGLPMIGSLGITCFGSAHHALGVAALTAGELDGAIDHLRAAVRHNLALAHWPAVVAARQRLAQAHALRGAPADADAARRERDEASSEATALGLPVPRLPVPDLPESGLPVPGLSASVPGQVPGQLAEHQPEPVAHCRRAGRRWQLAWQNRSVLVEDSVGMVHLAVLIANPRQEIRAADLTAGLTVLAAAAADGGAAHPVLDAAAIREYRTRLTRLAAEIDQLDPADDGDRASRARAERDWLVAQLAAATGFAGRRRSFPDQPERARVAVGKAIRRALGRVTEADAAIGEHLRQTVHTGVRCSYWPS